MPLITCMMHIRLVAKVVEIHHNNHELSLPQPMHAFKIIKQLIAFDYSNKIYNVVIKLRHNHYFIRKTLVLMVVHTIPHHILNRVDP